MAHPDLDNLLNTLYPFARRMLAKHGEFYPFAATINKQGKISCIDGYTGNDHPPSQEIIDLLVNTLKAQASHDEIKVAGICMDVRMSSSEHAQKVNALCAYIEHENGEAIEVYLPYEKGWFGHMKYGKITAQTGKHRIFGQK